jgi:hypothetical protein
MTRKMTEEEMLDFLKADDQNEDKFFDFMKINDQRKIENLSILARGITLMCFHEPGQLYINHDEGLVFVVFFDVGEEVTKAYIDGAINFAKDMGVDKFSFRKGTLSEDHAVKIHDKNEYVKNYLKIQDAESRKEFATLIKNSPLFKTLNLAVRNFVIKAALAKI